MMNLISIEVKRLQQKTDGFLKWHGRWQIKVSVRGNVNA